TRARTPRVQDLLARRAQRRALPLAVASLEKEEKADAMVKRAGLRMEVSRLSRVDDEGGVDEEGLGKREDAVVAFEGAVRVSPDSVVARNGLDRLKLVTE
uniref:Uncharacterized protein n=1 Tax=Chenopodium quinoa TaxID=63459 RepID=A0A803LK59_CHEQI